MKTGQARPAQANGHRAAVAGDAAAACDERLFREVIGHFASGVTVITARHEELDYGMTASAVSSLSLEPPMLLVCVNRATVTEKAISGSGAFGVNILHDGQGDVAERFAGPHSTSKFEGVEVSYGPLGNPMLADALARLECAVTETVSGGTHTIFLGRVDQAEAGSGAPLAYFRGSFGRFDQARDLALYDELRDRVMNRRVALGEALDVDDLATELDAERSSVHHALTRLCSEGLLSHAPGEGYVLTPVTVRVSDQTFDARCAVEVGVAELTVGRVPAEQLHELRRLMEETLPLIEDDRFVDLARYAQVNHRFHELQVSFAGSPPLSESYERLTNLGLIARTLSPSDAASSELVQDHRRLVEAYEGGDLDAARRTIVEHAQRTKETHRRAIESAGGEI
jgi:flavin reductase (DIM6/NTAB) family NADH-FMN oxidoreductase RutF/DNA-binding GntR family transcriptional regulator